MTVKLKMSSTYGKLGNKKVKDVSDKENNKISEYQFEKNKLYAYLGEDLIALFKRYNLIIAGGTITSLFTNNEINDIDVYARSEDDALAFVEEVWNDSIHIVSNTKKALQFMYGDTNVQLIHFKYFDNPKDIFETFDYTVCMGLFDFATEGFILHPDFLKHNSQRIIKFNSDTAFPIVSLLRVQKYEKKGYKISKPEFIRIILTCMNLDINTYEELKDQLGGMYGINYDKLFEDIEDEEFNLETAINKIADIALDEDYFKKPVTIEFNSLDDLVDSITKTVFKYININNKSYRIGHNGSLRKSKNVEKGEKIENEEYFNSLKIYKFVNKVDDTYSSFYENEFKFIEAEKEESDIPKYRAYKLRNFDVISLNGMLLEFEDNVLYEVIECRDGFFVQYKRTGRTYTPPEVNGTKVDGNIHIR